MENSMFCIYLLQISLLPQNNQKLVFCVVLVYVVRKANWFNMHQQHFWGNPFQASIISKGMWHVWNENHLKVVWWVGYCRFWGLGSIILPNRQDVRWKVGGSPHTGLFSQLCFSLPFGFVPHKPPHPLWHLSPRPRHRGTIGVLGLPSHALSAPYSSSS